MSLMAVTGGRICIELMHKRKYTALHTLPPLEFIRNRSWQSCFDTQFIKNFLKDIFITSTMNVNN